MGKPPARALPRHRLRRPRRHRFTPPHSTSVKYNIDTQHNFIAELAKWENALKPLWIDEARKNILETHNGTLPKVLDPFGGRGSIPLEAQRLGCETYACDLNPVSILIQKCTLEYPQKYGQRLSDDVKKWGQQILTQVTKELQPLYPKQPDGSEVFAYIWARTLPCQNLNCGTEIPLMNQCYLSKKRKIALYPYEENGSIAFRIVGNPGGEPIPNGFDPAKGTIAIAVVTCPLCKGPIPAADTRRLFQEGKSGERLLVVVTYVRGKGKRYRLATDADMVIFNDAQKRLAEKRERFSMEWEIDPVPDEPTPRVKGPGAERGISIHNYNINTYGELFNARQQLALVTFTEKIREAYQEMLTQGIDIEYASAVTTHL